MISPFRTCLQAGIATALLCLPLACNTGCQSWNARPPIEAMGEQILTEAIIPGIRAGLENGVESMNFAAGAEVINPGYEFEVEGLWVTGIRAKVTAKVIGVAGRFNAATVAAPPANP